MTMAEGKSRWQASIDATVHFLKSIFTATLCISVTFFPFLLMMTGQMHDFLLSFPWAISIVLFASMIIAQTLLPILQYFFIRKPMEVKTRADGKKPFNLLDLMDKYYKVLIDWCFNVISLPSRFTCLRVRVSNVRLLWPIRWST